MPPGKWRHRLRRSSDYDDPVITWRYPWRRSVPNVVQMGVPGRGEDVERAHSLEEFRRRHLAGGAEGVADGDARRVALGKVDVAADRGFAVLQDAQVPAAAVGGDECLEELRVVSVQRQFVAGPAWLADLEQSVAPPPDVADACFVLQHADNRDVLAEHRRAVGVAAFGLPGAKVLGWVGVDGLVRPAVVDAIGLPVARHIRPADEDARLSYRSLGDAADHRLAAAHPDHRGLPDIDGADGVQAVGLAGVVRGGVG